MKLVFLFLIAVLFWGCVAQRTPEIWPLKALVGTYNNDSGVDTHERIWLKPDGSSAYENTFYKGGRYTERDEGRWEVSGAKVVLWTKNDLKKEVRVFFAIADRGAAGLFLELDQTHSDRSANIPLFGGVYRRVSTEAPNKPPDPKAAPVTSRALIERLDRDYGEAKKKNSFRSDVRPK